MKALKLTALAVMLLLALAVAAQNTAVAAVRLLFWQVEMSIFLLIALTLGAGVVLGLAAGVVLRVSRTSRRR